MLATLPKQSDAAMQNIIQSSAQNAASTKQTEREAQNLHELGQMLELLVEQHKGEHTRTPMNDLKPARVC
jgi:hypothetical protein